MIVGNAILLALSLPLIRMWISILYLPQNMLGAIIVLFVGDRHLQRRTTAPTTSSCSWSSRFVGVGLKLADYPLAPAVLAFVLGRPIEASLRQSLVISQGDATIFLTRPISVVLLAIAAIVSSCAPPVTPARASAGRRSRRTAPAAQATD